MTVTATEVAATKTPASASDVMGALAAATKAILGGSAPLSALRMMAAHGALETADFQSMYNWNVGFIEHTSDNFDWYMIGSNPLHFRAYSSLDQGAADFVTLLKNHYPGTIQAANNGDLNSYVSVLENRRYAGAPCASGVTENCADYGAYESGMARYIRQFGGVLPSPAPGPLPSFNRTALVWAAAAATVTLALFRARST